MTSTPSNPYPGLRPFREDEEHLFFGREGRVDEMVDRLAAKRFLAVLGYSGSGKSSLVNSGLRPALRRGLMAEAGGAWRMVQFRPGADNPLRAMAEAMAAQDMYLADYVQPGLAVAPLIEANLSLSKLGLIDVYEQAQLAPDVNVLVVVDQFEELFRYARSDAAEHGRSVSEAAVAFVNVLLEAQAHPEKPIYVVLTMRSDFLGDCAQFPGLPEAINRGQYLVPRMTREERRRAIAGPARVAGTDVSPVLMERLLNDIGDDTDQLSVLQHALNRTWESWRENGATSVILPDHYEATGGMAEALDRHAEEAYEELEGRRQQAIAERVFKALTDVGTDPRGVRRPRTMRALCAVAGADEGEVATVIDVFRHPSRSFLMPPLPAELEPDTIVDIAHESLMRVWTRLRDWATDEAQSGRRYRRLCDTAKLFREGETGVLRDPELELALQWWDAAVPNPDWAGRYGGHFQEVESFLRESERERRLEEQRQRDVEELKTRNLVMKRVLAAAALAAAVGIVSGALASLLWMRAEVEADAIRLASAAERTVADDPEAALDFALAAARMAKNPETEAALREALRASFLRRMWSVPFDTGITALTFSADGARLAAGTSSGDVGVWDAATGLLDKALCRDNGSPHDNALHTIAFGADPEHLITVDARGQVAVWQGAEETGRRAVGDAMMMDISVRPVGDEIVVAAPDAPISLFNRALEPLPQRQHPASSAESFRLEHSAGGEYLAIAGTRTISVEEAPADGTTISVLDGQTGAEVCSTEQLVNADVYSLTFDTAAPDGHRLAASLMDATVRIWTVDRCQRPDHILLPPDPVQDLVFAADGSYLITGARDGEIAVWDLADDTRRPIFSRQAASDVDIALIAANPTSDRLATASFDPNDNSGTLTMWTLPAPDTAADILGRAERPASFEELIRLAEAQLVTAGVDLRDQVPTCRTPGP